MATYVWKGRTAGGETVSGELPADTQRAVIELLRKRNVIVTSVQEKTKGLQIPLLGGRGRRIKTRDLALFTRQMATMINAGLDIVACLDTQAKQAENQGFRKIIRSVTTDVEGGATFADALRKHRGAFSDLYVNMVAAGESSGLLDNILLRLADYLEKSEALARKIRGAMIYPSIIITVAVAATVILLVAVIPIFARMFTEMGAQLPLPTRIVISLSGFVQNYIIYVILAIAGIVIGLRAWHKTDSGQLVLDRVMLKLPVFGVLTQKAAIARFARTLGALLASGGAILDALEITAKTAGNRVIEGAVLEARKSIGSGETISGPLREMKVFPPMVTQMIAVGEATGGLTDMLAKIADFYDSEVDNAVANLTAALEPLIIVFLGLIVGGLVISMYLPIFKFITLIK
jgi:type IV pilus assembly protein PilC